MLFNSLFLLDLLIVELKFLDVSYCALLIKIENKSSGLILNAFKTYFLHRKTEILFIAGEKSILKS